MITFEEYQRLMKEAESRTMTGREYGKAGTFVANQPEKCPRCGAQVFDPFLFKTVIHDVVGCQK